MAICLSLTFYAVSASADAFGPAAGQESLWYAPEPALDPDLAVFFERYGETYSSDSVCDASACKLRELSLQTYTEEDFPAEGQAAPGSPALAEDRAGDYAAAATTWWYFSTDHYNLLMPGTMAGPYTYYLARAVYLSIYMDSAYTAASAVLGEDSGGMINVWLQYAAGNSTLGLFRYDYPTSIFLNLAASSSSSYMAGVAAHETSHLIFHDATNLVSRDLVGESWVSEALAYYVGNTVYAFGTRYGYDVYSEALEEYSNNGRNRSSWYDSGARYNGRGTSQEPTNLDYVQLNSIGYFLANSSRGWDAIQQTVDLLGGGGSIDQAFSAAYGMPTGQYNTASGPGVNTLYSEYLNYYLGHY